MLRTSLSYAVLGLAAVAMIAAGVFLSRPEPSDAGALGGPVILGGDDLTSHGGVDGGGNVVAGWLYIKNALASMAPNTSRGDGTIAALGSAASVETNSGDAGASIGAAAQELGLTVNYYDGDAVMTQFFADLAGSSVNPSIIWLAGNDGSNDTDSAEDAVLTANATALASFVASGGGLMSHGTNYGWLSALLPGVTTVCCGSGDDLYFTPEGMAALGSLTVSDINAGPWHNHFEGDFGGLDVLVRSSLVDDSSLQDAAVVLGGAAVTFEEQPPAEEETDVDCTPGIPSLPCGSEGGGSGPEDYDSNPADSTPVAQPTTAPPAPVEPAPTSPTGSAGAGGAGPIIAPDTGSGPGGGGSSPMGMAVLAVAVAAAGGGLVLAGRRVRS